MFNSLQSIKILRQVPSALVRSVKRFSSDEVLVRASSLAFSSMLAMIPIATIGLGVFSNFASFHQQLSQVKEVIIRTFLPGIGSVLEKHIDGFISNADSLSIIGIAALLFSSALLMYEIHNTFDRLFGSPCKMSVREKLLEFWAIITGLPFAIFSVSSVLSTLLDRSGVNMGDLWEAWQVYTIPWFLILIVLLLFSPKKTAFLATLIGATIGSVFYGVAQYVFIEYVSLPILPNLLYGALAVVPLLQLWLLIIWMIVIFSATISAELLKEYDV